MSPPAPPRPFVVHEALVMPLKGTLNHFKAGVFRNGECLDESLLYRDRKPKLYGGPASAAEVAAAMPGADRLRGDYLFGGYLFRHYGHFLIETLSRVYALKQCPPLPILFSSTHRDILPWQLEVFKLLGLRNEIVKLERPTMVDRLVMSTPAFVLPDVVHEAQIAALGAVAAPPLTDRKIWLARSSHIGGGLLNEDTLHPLLKELGWEIVHPQFLPLRKQIALIASSARVAGLDGSAFHTALLAREIRGCFDIFFLRNTTYHAYTRIAQMKGFTQREIRLSEEDGTVRFLLGQGAERFYELKDSNAVLWALQ